jgi:S1-C subfamily serine protease
MALSLPVLTHEVEPLSPAERMRPKNIVESIAPESLGEAAGIRVRDRILTVNGEPIHDIVDWRFHTAGEQVTLTLLRGGVQRHAR